MATPNCANVVTHEKDGLIVPARDSEQLAAAIARLDHDRRLLRTLSANALQTVQKYQVPSNGLGLQEQVARFRQQKAALAA